MSERAKNLVERFSTLNRNVINFVENCSDEPAIFELLSSNDSRQVEVPPEEVRPIELGFSAQGERISLIVQGEEEGVYLWGAPHIAIQGGTDLPGPVVLVTLDTTRRDALTPSFVTAALLFAGLLVAAFVVARRLTRPVQEDVIRES